jgi:large subunit ribosomal protein L4
VFGPRPRDYDFKLNLKVRRLARRSALSAKAQAGQIVVVEDFNFEAPKTKAFNNILRSLNVEDKKPLTVTAEYNKMLYLSCRNIDKAAIAPAAEINTYQIMKAGVLVISESAVSKIVETLD